jgi:hypothetical protein
LEAETLLDFKSNIDQMYEIDDISDITAKNSRRITSGLCSVVSLVNYAEGDLRMKAWSPKENAPGEAFEINREVSADLLNKGKSINIVVPSKAGLAGGVSVTTGTPVLGVPIITNDTIYGTIVVCGKGKTAFSQETERSLKALAQSAASALARARLLLSLREIDSAITGALELDSALDDLLQVLTDRLGFEFATVSLVDDYRGTIETIKAKNVPAGWLKRSKHKLDSIDIQAAIIRTRRTEIIRGPDPRFDTEIYERFGHKLA